MPTIRDKKPASKRLAPVALMLGAALLWPGSVIPAARADDSLYRALGGKASIAHVVDAAFARWMADDRVKSVFDNINPDWLKRRLVNELCEVAGGPCHYKGPNMYLAHKGLHIDQAQFNAVVEGLEGAMDQCDVPFRVQNRLLGLLAPLERDIVTR